MKKRASLRNTAGLYAGENMVDLERIKYQNLYSNVAEYIDYTPARYVDTMQPTVCAAAQNPSSILSAPSQSRAKAMIKSIVKRTPLGWIIISKRKRKYLRDIFSDESKPTLDLNIIMGFEDAPFLAEIFDILLGREMSHDEFIKFYTMLKAGMPKEAMVYILCNSVEKDQNIAVESFCDFEKAYFRYIYKQRIINLPVLNYIIALFILPMRLQKLERHMIMLDINSLDRVNGEMHCIQTAEKNIINIMKER